MPSQKEETTVTANANTDDFHTKAKANAKGATNTKAKAKAKVATKAKAITSPSLTPQAKAAGASPTTKRPAAAFDPALEEPSGAPFVVCVLACVQKYFCFKSQIT